MRSVSRQSFQYWWALLCSAIQGINDASQILRATSPVSPTPSACKLMPSSEDTGESNGGKAMRARFGRSLLRWRGLLPTQIQRVKGLPVGWWGTRGFAFCCVSRTLNSALRASLSSLLNLIIRFGSYSFVNSAAISCHRREDLLST